MTDQIRISDSGELESVPMTWDGEPLYSPSSVAEGLFDADAFEQMRGQIAMVEPICTECGHALISHYAVRMVDHTHELNGHCGDHTGCEACDAR